MESQQVIQQLEVGKQAAFRSFLQQSRVLNGMYTELLFALPHNPKYFVL